MLAYVFPGQGSQYKGMGKALFAEFSTLCALADDVLGYSIRQLCLEDPQQQLNQTRYTQPAIYVVSALSYVQWLEQSSKKADFLAGHSLGEYTALFAAGVFDFATGLQLVKKRAELMAQANAGGMAAVLGITVPQIRQLLQEQQFHHIEVANYNSASQTVLSGDLTELRRAVEVFSQHKARCVLLPVSAAFHSRFMQDAEQHFAAYLQDVHFQPPATPVIANVTARPHQAAALRQTLARQITAPVQWHAGVDYLLAQGVTEFKELGPGNVLSKLVSTIQAAAVPAPVAELPAVV
jgi:trans-AT polyketide synthase/acyltransferase/oxidoreductase domain-containing protein